MGRQLIFPYDKDEPNVADERLVELDSIADGIELERLSSMDVLLDSSCLDGVSYKQLSTRFVRSWRDKQIELDGKLTRVWLRRSRFVAREFSWLSDEKQSMFSPASSAISSRILPTVFLQHKADDWVLMSCDVQDAFLTVRQKEPTMVIAKDADGREQAYALGRVLPGQRAGSLLWNEAITNHLKDVLDMEECTIYPSMLKTKDNKLFILLHVDDFLVTGHVDMVEKRLIPALKSSYKISYSIIRQMGEELTFLKRSHVLLNDELMLIKPHHRHISHLKEIVSVHPKAYPKKTPSHPSIDDEDDTVLLSAEMMAKYRSAVGTLLYLAADLPHCQHCIRFLATKMTAATEHCWQVLKHLVLYLSGTQDVCLSLNFKGQQRGVFHDYTSVEHAIVEVYTDADWASSKGGRRSISSCAIFYGGCLLHTASRTQKIVSLSSAESEMYAAASGACDAVLIIGILTWMFDSFFQMCLYLDSAAARGIINRRGVDKVRHLSCRCLWLQARMADGSMIVSPISGLKNPADIGTKRLNVQRMRALIGMFDSMNNCHVGEVEARAILQQQDLKQAMSSLRRLMKSDVDASGALQLMMFMNALSVVRGMDDSATASNHVGWGWWFGYLLQIMTLVACMIAGMVFLVRGLARQQQRAQIHVENVVEAPLAAVDGPAVGRGRRRVHARNIVGQMVQV